ncbi:hypothetical protein FRB94_009047 [Tulasnella sp. JGI-2019a]|nr:hypothetical protein FRB94_009047 [Tulasnella sp. JGI-2019a]
MADDHTSDQTDSTPVASEVQQHAVGGGAPDTTESLEPTKRASLSEKIEVWQGDITTLDVDVIVNAANNRLLGGAGVDGAIHRAAGPELKKECKTLGGCETGNAKITKGYNLPASHVIHAVGPIYDSDEVERVAKLLQSCYGVSLRLAVEAGLKSIAFPSISTGIYGYPIEDATPIALKTTREFLESEKGAHLDKVIFCVFSDEDKRVYEMLTPEYFPKHIEPVDTSHEAQKGEVVQESSPEATPDVTQQTAPSES